MKYQLVLHDDLSEIDRLAEFMETLAEAESRESKSHAPYAQIDKRLIQIVCVLHGNEYRQQCKRISRNIETQCGGNIRTVPYREGPCRNRKLVIYEDVP